MNYDFRRRLPGGVTPSQPGRLRRLLYALPLLLGAATILHAEDAPNAGRELLRLVPPKTCVILAVDDLRGHVREVMASRLMKELLAVPVMKSWFEGEKYHELEEGRDKLEEVFQTPLTEIRDRILGDAVVFALDLPPESIADPSNARGLLILKASDPALLQRLIDTFNTIQRNNGEVTEVEEHTWHGHDYHVRKFPPGTSRRIDAYVTFPDGTFAISNSAEVIQQVIDGKSSKSDEPQGSGSGSSAMARYRAVQDRLPKRAVARLLVDTTAVSRLLNKATTPRSAGQSLIEQHLAALTSVGAALVVHDGRISLEVAEVFEQVRFRQVFGDRGNPATKADSPRRDQIPTTSLAAGELELSIPELYQTLIRLVPEQDQPRLASIEAVLRGLLLGQDFRTKVLPRLGPGILAYVDAPADWTPNPEQGKVDSPASQWPFPLVAVVELTDGSAHKAGVDSPPHQEPSITAAVDNALSTLLAVIALDEKRGNGRAKVVTREARGLTIKALEPALPFAFAVDHQRHRLILGNSPGAIVQFAIAQTGVRADAGIRRVQSLAFPDARSFVCLDLAAIHSLFVSNRETIAGLIAGKDHRNRDQVARDLEGAAALARIFEIAFWSHRIDGPSATAFHTFGLLAAHGEGATTPPKP